MLELLDGELLFGDDAFDQVAAPICAAVAGARMPAVAAGAVGLGGEGEQRHQGGGRGERDDQGKGQASEHGGMVAPGRDQTKMRAFDSLAPHQQYRGP